MYFNNFFDRDWSIAGIIIRVIGNSWKSDMLKDEKSQPWKRDQRGKVEMFKTVNLFKITWKTSVVRTLIHGSCYYMIPPQQVTFTYRIEWRKCHSCPPAFYLNELQRKVVQHVGIQLQSRTLIGFTRMNITGKVDTSFVRVSAYFKVIVGVSLRKSQE